MRLGVTLLAVLALLARTAVAVTLPPPGITFVDDRGQPIQVALMARLVGDVGGTAPSVRLPPGGTIPASWSGVVEVEGEDYGPARRAAADFRGAAGRVVVPRKATLTFGEQDERPVALTYSVISDGALIPWAKQGAPGPASMKVPAGSGLLSATRQGRGRFNRLFLLSPGAAVRVYPVFSEGSAALVRVLRLSDGRPVPNARVKEVTPPTDAGERREARLCQSDEAGLCLVSYAAGQVPAVIEAEGFVPLVTHFGLEQGEPRLVETVRLSSGSRPLFRILVDGVAGNGLPVSLRPGTTSSEGLSAEEARERAGFADGEGKWRPGVVPPGSWIVWVRARKGQPAFEKTVELAPDSEPVIDVSLDPIRITGAVTRGSRGVEGVALVVGTRDLGEKRTTTERYAKEQEIVTDADGEFEAFVWREGLYTIAAPSLARKTVDVPKTGARVVLRLAENDLVCSVVDPDGRPVAGAAVTHKESEREESFTGSRKTDDAGKVSFPVRVGNEFSAYADAPGYRRSEKVTLVIPEDGPVGPLTLQLQKDDELQGRFVGPMGTPVSGALILAAGSSGQPIRTSESTDAEGRFRVSRSGGAAVRLFFVSPRAPLTIHDVYDVGQREELVFPPGETGSLDIQLAGKNGMPVPARAAVLQFRGVVVPPVVVAQHLAARGLAALSDARGSLLVPDLPTGDYTVILPDVAASTGLGPLRADVYVGPGRNTVRITLEEVPR